VGQQIRGETVTPLLKGVRGDECGAPQDIETPFGGVRPGQCNFGSMALVEVPGRRDRWILSGRQPCGDANS
jgi:hypothetical protein